MNTVHLGRNDLLPGRTRQAAVHQNDPPSRHPVDGGGTGLIYLGPETNVSNNSIDKSRPQLYYGDLVWRAVGSCLTLRFDDVMDIAIILWIDSALTAVTYVVHTLAGAFIGFLPDIFAGLAGYNERHLLRRFLCRC